MASDKPNVRDVLRAVPFALGLVYEANPKGVLLNVLNEVSQAPLAAVSIVALKRLTDALTAARWSEAWMWSEVFIAVGAAFAVYGYIRERQSDHLRFQIDLAVQKKRLQYLMRLPFATLEDPAFQTLSSAFGQRSYAFLSVANASISVLRDVFSMLGLMTVFVYLPWIVTACLLVAQLVRLFFIQQVRDWSWSVLSMETREGRRALYYQNVLALPQSVLPAKAVALDKPFYARWHELTSRILAERLRVANVGARALGFGDAFEVLGLGIGLGLLVRAASSGTLAVSVIIVFVTTYQRFQNAIGNVIGNVMWWSKEADALPLLQRFFSYAPERDRGKSLPRRPVQVVFEDVWFRYPGSDQDVLRGISWSFSEGEHVALVGLNGSGKSTLLKLLMRVYEPTRGRITVNGVDLKNIKPSAWRRALSVLTQNIQPYDDTIKNQVWYGDFDRPLNKKRLQMSLKVSGLQGVADEFSRGLETHAGRHYAMPEDPSVELSGGQNQIVAIARTLYREARMCVFDEPTSAVDAEKEERFFEALPEALQSQAVIFVSHRFSTLRRAERIIVIDQGKVIEQGTHEELMALHGRYAELFVLQAKMYQ